MANQVPSPSYKRRLAGAMFLWKAISKEPASVEDLFTRVTSWNDRPSRTKGQVIAAYKKAIKLAKAARA